MEIKRLASCRVLLLDNIPDPRLAAEDSRRRLAIENQLYLPSDKNPYLTEALREITDGLRERMVADTENFFELGFGLPFMAGGMGAHNVDIFISLYVSEENLLILPKFTKRPNWMICVPSPEHNPNYSLICDLLFQSIKDHIKL